jgi:hypothetical protein
VVAPVEAFQLNVTELPDCVGPGLLLEPGLRPVGLAGIVTAEGVWKYRAGVVKDDWPAEFPAATFQRYTLPAVKLAV